MASVSLKGNPIELSGIAPQVGTVCPNFSLVRANLSEASLETYAGKKKVLNIFPSLDTGTCGNSVRRFNQEAAALSNFAVLNISADLPFAQKRFCGSEGIQNSETLSAFRSQFGQDWGLQMMNGPIKGLLARTVVVLDENNKVIYVEQVAEISQEPNYENALKAIKG